MAACTAETSLKQALLQHLVREAATDRTATAPEAASLLRTLVCEVSSTVPFQLLDGSHCILYRTLQSETPPKGAIVRLTKFCFEKRNPPSVEYILVLEQYCVLPLEANEVAVYRRRCQQHPTIINCYDDPDIASLLKDIPDGNVAFNSKATVQTIAAERAVTTSAQPHVQAVPEATSEKKARKDKEAIKGSGLKEVVDTTELTVNAPKFADIAEEELMCLLAPPVKPLAFPQPATTHNPTVAEAATEEQKADSVEPNQCPETRTEQNFQPVPRQNEVETTALAQASTEPKETDLPDRKQSELLQRLYDSADNCVLAGEKIEWVKDASLLQLPEVQIEVPPFTDLNGQIKELPMDIKLTYEEYNKYAKWRRDVQGFTGKYQQLDTVLMSNSKEDANCRKRQLLFTVAKCPSLAKKKKQDDSS